MAIVMTLSLDLRVCVCVEVGGGGRLGEGVGLFRESKPFKECVEKKRGHPVLMAIVITLSLDLRLCVYGVGCVA